MPSPIVTVRLMTEDDRGSVVELMQESDLDLGYDSFLVERHEEMGVIFVGSVGPRVVGFLHGRFDSDYADHLAGQMHIPQAWVWWIVVREDCRREGVGSELIKGFSIAAQSAGCSFTACLVEDSAGFESRMAFFERIGMSSLSEQDPAAVGAPISRVLQASG